MDEEILKKLEALVAGVDFYVTNLANAAALIFEEFEDVSWAGFYILDGGVLKLGPFQGKVACVEIPLSKGVCGKAAREEKTVIVENVHEFAGHIACDSRSNSEIVVPIFKDKKLFGVIDLDSEKYARFGKEDAKILEKIAEIIEKTL